MPRKLFRLITAFVAIGGIVPAQLPAAAPPSAEFRNGRWEPIAAPTSRPASDPALDRAEQALINDQPSAAFSLVSAWVKQHKQKSDPLRDRAVYLLGVSEYQLDDRLQAFYYFDELMDEYPESSLFYRALEMQYRTADELLSGHKLKFLGMAIVGAEDEAIEMLFRIQQRSPGSPLAEKALLRTADYYYASADYDLSSDAYAMYVKNYPRSPSVPQARLRQAFSSLAQFRGTRFDAAPIIDARAQLVDIQASYPDLAAEQNIADVVKSIDNTLARKIFEQGDFYRRTKQPKAAAYEFRYLLVTYPDSAVVPETKQAIKQLPEWALAGPDPLPGKEYQAPAGSGSLPAVPGLPEAKGAR